MTSCIKNGCSTLALLLVKQDSITTRCSLGVQNAVKAEVNGFLPMTAILMLMDFVPPTVAPITIITITSNAMVSSKMKNGLMKGPPNHANNINNGKANVSFADGASNGMNASTDGISAQLSLQDGISSCFYLLDPDDDWASPPSPLLS